MATSLTWYTDANYVFPDYSSAAAISRSTLWTLKAYLTQQIVGVNNGTNGTAPASAAWTVMGSSDGVTAGMDSVDRWGSTYDATKLVFAAAGSAHSWIVLRSPTAIASNAPYYLLIDCSSASVGSVAVLMSLSAFTGGSITTAPTSTGSTSFGAATATSIATETSGATASYAHITRTATGAFYFLSFRQGLAAVSGCFFGVVPLVGVQSNDQWRVWGVRYNAAISAVDTWRLCARGYNLAVSGDTNNCTIQPTFLSSGGLYVNSLSGLNAATGQYDGFPVGAYTNAAGATGYRGYFPDLFVIGTGRVIGDVVPASGVQEYIATPNVLLPFNCPLSV